MRELKVGMTLFQYREGMSEYRISSIKKPNCKQRYTFKIEHQTHIYCIEKNRFTWVKKSKKNFDYGWAKSIDRVWKIDFSIAEYQEHGLPSGLSFTKSGALREAIKNQKTMLKRAERDGDSEWFEECRKQLFQIKRQQTKMRG